MATPRGSRAPAVAPAAAPPLTRIGGLLLWEFRKTPTPLPKLAKLALEVGYPTLFLPLPISYREAFRRALERAAAKVPQEIGGRWQADQPTLTDRMLKDLPMAPADLDRIRAAKPQAAGILERWAPDRPLRRPWVVELLCFLCPSQPGGLLVLDLAQTEVSEKMEARLREFFRRQVSLAMAPEIGAGLKAALVDAHGVKWRPGVWFAPRDRGVALVGAASRYVRQIGDSTGNSLDLYDDVLQDPGNTGEARKDLEARVESYAGKVGQTLGRSPGIRALRNLWDEAHELTALVEANEAILADQREQLLARIWEASQELRARAAKLDNTLERSASAAHREHLGKALKQIRAAAKRQDAAALKQALPTLDRGRPAALADRIAPLVIRLHRLAEATALLEDPELFKALAQAVDLVEERAGPLAA